MTTRLLTICVLALATLVCAPAASARQNYQPWKCAELGWWQHYVTATWLPQQASARANGQYLETFAQCSFPLGDDPLTYWRNGWDAGAQNAATFITAIEGPFPCQRFTVELQRILTPYLGYVPAGMGTRSSPQERARWMEVTR